MQWSTLPKVGQKLKQSAHLYITAAFKMHVIYFYFIWEIYIYFSVLVHFSIFLLFYIKTAGVARLNATKKM